MRAGRDDEISAHFVGSIVYIEKGLYQVIQPVAAAGHRRPAAADHGHAALEALARDTRRHRARRRLLGQKAAQLLLLNPLEDGERASSCCSPRPTSEPARARAARQPYPREHSLRVAARTSSSSRLRCGRWDTDLAACAGPGQARDRRHLAQPRPGQPAAHLREHELDRPGAEPGRPDPQLRPHGPGARPPDPALRAPLAADGGGLRPGGLRRALRRASCATT